MRDGGGSSNLDALEARSEAIDAFIECQDVAREYIRDHGTDELIAELRAARDARRRIRLGTTNTLILLHHIDRLEAELAKEPYRG